MRLQRVTKIKNTICCLFLLSLLITSSTVMAECTTVMECAQQAANSAAKSSAAVMALQARVEKLEMSVQSFGNGRILAILEIVNGDVKIKYPENVTYDQTTGHISFSNNTNLKFIPIISDITTSSDPGYLTRTHWIVNITPPNGFTVRATALDTGGHVFPATSFTAVVIGVAP
jgi:hypothetical protein